MKEEVKENIIIAKEPEEIKFEEKKIPAEFSISKPIIQPEQEIFKQNNIKNIYGLPVQKVSEAAIQSDISSAFWMSKLATPQLNNAFSEQSTNEVQLIKSPLDQVNITNDYQVTEKKTSSKDLILAAKINELPTELTMSCPHENHHHIHCEFCGHCTIIHNGHIDYVHDAELHFLDAYGILIILWNY